MDYLRDLMRRRPEFTPLEGSIKRAFDLISASFRAGGKLLAAGNGGSAADSDHIAGELMKGFVKKRPVSEEFKLNLKRAAHGKEDYAEYLASNLQGALPVIALSNHNALNTAFLNDVSGALTFAQQVSGYGKKGDVLLAITTSGNSKNILYAMITAKALGLKVVLLTGGTGGAAREFADEVIIAGESETYKVQEVHLPVYHCLCLMLEEEFF